MNRSMKTKHFKTLMISFLFVLFCGLVPLGCGSQRGVVDQGASVSTERSMTEETEGRLETEVQETETEQESEATEIDTAGTAAKGSALKQTMPSTEVTVSIADIPAYNGSPYVAVNDNVPQFLETDLSTSSYEYYSDLDSLGRCGVVYACIGMDLMPTEERGSIGSVKPTGWHTVKYDTVDGKYLYNRCHLIGYQLSGENANVKNLITGTRYLNVDGMLPFENMVADYVKETNHHVMYRVTPVFDGDNLLASGVQIEAESVEDNGEGILFNVYCYNVQPNVAIDYATGDSSLAGGDVAAQNDAAADASVDTAAASYKGAKSDSNAASDSNADQADESSKSSGSTDQTADNGQTSDNSGTSAQNPSGGSDTLMVYKSATGDKYHSINNCGRMNPNKATQITEAEAIRQGLGKCSKCW